MTTIHHPITRDRRVEIDAARGWRKLSVARWYGFVRMQGRVARQLDTIVGVSGVSADDDTADDFGLDRGRVQVIPLGVDTELVAPARERRPGRVVTVASADKPPQGRPAPAGDRREAAYQARRDARPGLLAGARRSQ
ncbi:glycosyltransferase family 4 protein [Aeromicrobium sp. PE09-221]|uniref:glycosyltransferase family 4 protein n=1 Tax=Aeromicrobium sp. PE09-221 TaxID=1898043 RepID=UPI001F15B00D|nr:glycosyltransferase family 4 protein [Aeromicrobium sp. PE09-221]